MIYDFKIIETNKRLSTTVWSHSFQFKLHDNEPFFYSFFLEYKDKENRIGITGNYRKGNEKMFSGEVSFEEREEIGKIILSQPQYRLKNLMKEYEIIFL